MEKRRITLNDGRYLIYYSFEDEENLKPSPPEVASSSESETKQPEKGDKDRWDKRE